MSEKKVIIIGGGLAGVEAAYQVSKQGIAAELYEMRPEQIPVLIPPGSWVNWYAPIPWGPPR